VSQDALEYEAFVRSKNNSRKDADDEDDDGDDDGGIIEMDVDDEEEDEEDDYDDEDDDDDDCEDGDCHEILVPGTRPPKVPQVRDGPVFSGVQKVPNASMLRYSSRPDASDRRTVRTMEEIVTPSAATRQFETNMDFVSGPNSASGVVIRRGAELYKDIDRKLSRPLTSQAFRRYAIQRGMTIPDPPTVYKAQVQDARQAPDPALGERPCARGKECTSYKMSAKRKQEDPQKYAHVEPFVCKEFFFGPRGQKMRNAIASGIPLTAVKGVQGERLVLCVMCHESEVTRFYKMYEFGVSFFLCYPSVIETDFLKDSYIRSHETPGS